MPDRNKVIEGLEYHLSEITIGKKCFQCPYYGDNPCEQILIASTLELLKEQEPRVLALEEAFDLQNRTPYPCIFVEIRERDDVFLATINDELYGDYHSEKFKVHRPWIGVYKEYHKTEYGQSIRFWNLYPTDKYRRTVEWDER